MYNPPFTLADARRANNEWGANCGPGALAAIMGMTLDEVRSHMADFESKHYTNPTLMFDALKSIGRPWRKHPQQCAVWPEYGLCRSGRDLGRRRACRCGSVAGTRIGLARGSILIAASGFSTSTASTTAPDGFPFRFGRRRLCPRSLLDAHPRLTASGT